MPDPHEVLQVLVEWIQKAESDFAAATGLLRLGRKCPAEAVCFHAQQCVEKYLKSLLVLQAVHFPKTHEIERIAALLPGISCPPLQVKEQRQLTRYATVMRYPGDYSPPDLAEARAAVGLARCVRSWCRKLLPPAALRKSGPKPR